MFIVDFGGLFLSQDNSLTRVQKSGYLPGGKTKEKRMSGLKGASILGCF